MYGCDWYNFISTNISARRGNGGGYDALPDNHIFWNLTLPAHGFLYVESLESSFQVQERYTQVLERLGRELCTEAGRQILLATIDALWTDYLSALERLDEAIGLRGYAELDPLTEFRRESGLLFQELLREIRLDAAAEICALDEVFVPENDDLPRGWAPAQARTERRTLKR